VKPSLEPTRTTRSTGDSETIGHGKPGHGGVETELFYNILPYP